MHPLLGVGAVVLLILANGWFVAAEFAYVAVRRGPLKERADRGERRAIRALEVRSRVSFMLSGAQLGITATSLVVGFVAQPTIGAALTPAVRAIGLPEQTAQGLALSGALFLATASQMIFGELAPKNLAIARAEQVSIALARGVALYLRVAGPIIWLFDSAATRLLQVFGIKPVEELTADISSEELELIIAESGREGALTERQATLLGRVLGFHDLRADDVMVPRMRVVWLPVEATCEDLRALAVETGHSRFPVCGNGLDDVVGVVQAKDVFRVPLDVRSTTSVAVLAAAPLAVPESAAVPQLLMDLRTSHSPMAVVVDEHGGTAGVATLEDIVEELVGSIEDEYDVAEPAITALPEGGFLVPGALRLDEVMREIEVHLPAGDYDTLGGLVMTSLGRVPEAGDEVHVAGVHLVVEEMEGHAVGRVRISSRAIPDANDEDSP